MGLRNPSHSVSGQWDGHGQEEERRKEVEAGIGSSEEGRRKVHLADHYNFPISKTLPEFFVWEKSFKNLKRFVEISSIPRREAVSQRQVAAAVGPSSSGLRRRNSHSIASGVYTPKEVISYAKSRPQRDQRT